MKDVVRKKTPITLAELLVVVAIIGILWALVVPIFDKSHPPPRRWICANQLKEIGEAICLYAEEHGGRLPPVDGKKNNFIFSGPALFPEYIEEIDLLACPFDSEYSPSKSFRLAGIRNHPDSSIGDIHPDCITDMSYAYLGWMIMDDKEAEAFFEAYDKMSSDDYDKNFSVVEGKGNSGGNTIHRLSMDVDEFLITDTNTIFTGDESGASVVPIMWDRLTAEITDFNHVPAGQNVLYLDGHVDFWRYDEHNTEFPVTPKSAALFGECKRAPIPDCEE
jgi:prepilin-type processing-associated H-X9-DG protein